MQQVHIAIVGDRNVGKSTYLLNYYEGPAEVWNTNYGNCNIIMTEYNDISLVPNDINGIIIMYDITNMASFQLAINYLAIATKITNNVVVCGNKADNKHRKVKAVYRKTMLVPTVKHFDISCYSNYQYNKPIEFLMQCIYGMDFLFLDQEAILPPDIDVINIANFHKEYIQ